MKLERLANKIVSVVNADDSVNLAIRHMWQYNIRHLPVVRENIPIGMISDRDILFHVCWLDHTTGSKRQMPAMGTTRVDKIMSRPVVALAPDEPVENAVRVMVDKQISSIALVSHDQIVGIVTESDFLRCYNDESCLVLSQKSRQCRVEESMSANVHTVRRDDAAHTAIRLMRDKRVRHLVVMDDDRLAGIISDRDVLRGSPRSVSEHAISADQLRLSHTLLVEGIMTKQPKVISWSDTVAQAASTMVQHKIGALPVLANGQLSGIITETDLLRAFVRDSKNIPARSKTFS